MSERIDHNLDSNVKPDPFPNASEVWKFLAGITDYEKMLRFGKGRTAWNLDGMRNLLEFLGHPDRDFPIVHVSGTKGKGSTARLLEAALRQGGAATGLYTSPHVDFPLERIDLGGSSLSEETFIRLMNRLHPALCRGGATAPTFFEIFTALALAAFQESGVDIAILEVGLGGRLDATNAVTRTAVSVITSISRDHTHLLGDTLEAIAAEKAGILRPGVPAVLGVRPGEAGFPPLEAAARKAGAPLRIRGRHFDVVRYHPAPTGAVVDFRIADRWLEDLEIGLLGRFQARNAAVALAVLCALEETGGPAFDEAAVRSAWRLLQIPGRLEILRRDPVVAVDGAHNRASAVSLLSALEAHLPGKSLVLVLGMAGDKLVEETAAPLMRAADRIHLTRTANPRSLDPMILKRLATRLGKKKAWVHASSRDAMEAAVDGQAANEVVVAAGSLYLTGEVRAWAGCVNSSQ